MDYGYPEFDDVRNSIGLPAAKTKVENVPVAVDAKLAKLS